MFFVKDTASTASATLYVNSTEYAIDENDDAAMVVTGNLKGLENISLFEVPGSITTDIKAGDIVNVNLRNGKITQVSVVYTAGADRAYRAPVDDYQIHDGGTQVMGDVIGIDPERSMLLVDCKSEVLPIFVHSQAEIEIFDEEAMKYIIGTVSDIYEGNYVRIEMGNNQVTSVVVFH